MEYLADNGGHAAKSPLFCRNSIGFRRRPHDVSTIKKKNVIVFVIMTRAASQQIKRVVAA
jgi:phosphopantothenoylcysteine synthetase/decarboxylase